MLPFLDKKRQQTGVIVKTRKPDEKPKEIQDYSTSEAIHACAQDLINAVHARDVAGAADAIKAAFEILEAMPHEEALEPHSYESQAE